MILRRIGAFIIDMLFISLLVGMLQQINFLNPKFEDYQNSSYDVYNLMEDAMQKNDLSILESQEFMHMSYQLSRNGIYSDIIETVVLLAYFAGFQIWNRGQTLGKKLFKIKIVDQSDQPAKWYQIFLREFIALCIFLDILLIILLVTLKENAFINASGIINEIRYLVSFIIVFFILLRSDKRGLHDLITKTKVVRE